MSRIGSIFFTFTCLLLRLYSLATLSGNLFCCNGRVCNLHAERGEMTARHQSLGGGPFGGKVVPDHGNDLIHNPLVDFRLAGLPQR